MKVRLEIPTIAGNKGFELEATMDDSRSHYGIPVILVPMHEEHPSTFLQSDRGIEYARLWPSEQDILDGATFRMLHKAIGAIIVTDDPDKVCMALGIPKGESGIQLQ